MEHKNLKQPQRPNRQRPPQMNQPKRKRVQHPNDERQGRMYKAESSYANQNPNYLAERRGNKSNKEYQERQHHQSYSYAHNRGVERYSRPVPPRREANISLKQPELSMKKRVFLIIYNLIFYLITISVVATGIMVFFSGKNDSAIMGYRFYRVLTASMKPQPDSPPGGFDQGAVAIVKLMNGKDAKEGDIVTYALGDGGFFLTHRLVERIGEMEGREGNYVLTQGDANESQDPPVDERQIVGKVVYAIPKVGNLVQFVQEQFWSCLVCVLSLFGFFLVLRAYLTSDSPGEGPSRRIQPKYY